MLQVFLVPSIMLTILVAVALFLCIIHILCNYNSRARLIRKLPGSKDHFIIGNGFHCVSSPAQFFYFMRDYYNKWKPINRFWTFPIGIVNIYEPNDIETVISSSKHNAKSPPYYFLKNWLRDGLLLSKGSKWQARRKILTSAFHFNILRQFCDIIEDNSSRMVDTIGESKGEPVDVMPTVTEYAVHSICETAMGSGLRDETKESQQSYKEAIHVLGNQFMYRLCRLHLHSDFTYNLLSSKKQSRLEIAHKFTEKVIKERKEYVKNHPIFNPQLHDNNQYDNTTYVYKNKKVAMLDLLITAEKEGLIDDIGIQEEVDTFMFAGHDTTAAALTFTLMLLANHSSIQENIIAELDDIFGDSTRPATIDDLSQMRYLERCIKESLRLYPPVPGIGRVLNEDVKLSGYTVPKGTYCHIQIFDLHRREDLYKDPLVFDPDRFLTENCVDRHPYAYIPFSAGSRNCMGQKFALLEMKSALSSILRHYKLLPVTKPDDLKFTANIVLRTKNPVFVRFIKR